jgi:ribose transport system substrate-binding protein
VFRKNYIWIKLIVAAVVIAILAIGCAKPQVSTTTAEETTAATEATTTSEAPATETAAVEEEKLGEIKTIGPEGQIPIWYTEIKLTDEEKEKVKKMGLKIAYDQLNISEFDDAIGFAIDDMAKQLNMKYIWTYNRMDAAIQKENIETILAAKPDIVSAVSVDPAVSTVAFKEAYEQGAVLVFCSCKADLKWPDEYKGGLVFYDLVGFAPELAGALNDALGGEGNIGYVYHEANFFITNQRDQGFKDALKEFPGLKIVAEEPWSGNAADAEAVVSAMITKNPEINGMYLPWQEAAMPAISALRAADRMDIKIVTNDIGKTTALEMITGDNIIMMSQCAAWQYGVTVVELGLYPILGKEIPAECVIVPGYTATRDNIEEVWPKLYNKPLPTELKAALGENK